VQLGDWYSITRQQITRGGGRGLFDYYPSLEAALRAVYPHFPWQTSKFEDAERLRKGYKDVLNGMKKAEEMFNIKQVRVVRFNLFAYGRDLARGLVFSHARGFKADWISYRYHKVEARGVVKSEIPRFQMGSTAITKEQVFTAAETRESSVCTLSCTVPASLFRTPLISSARTWS